MSDWDHIDAKKKVPRNDPAVDRNKYLSLVDDVETTVVRSGMEFYKNQNLKNEARDKRREKNKEAIQRFSPEQIRTRRKLRKMISKQEKTSPDNFAGKKNADAVQLNAVNLVVFLVALALLGDVFDRFPLALRLITYGGLWFISRNMARKFLLKYL